MTITFSLLLVLIIVTAALAVFDGIVRVRGRGAAPILAIIEIVAAVLLALVQFVAFPAPFTTWLFSLILEIVLVLLLIFRGGVRRGFAAVTVIALILNAAVLLMTLGWLHIPGFN